MKLYTNYYSESILKMSKCRIKYECLGEIRFRIISIWVAPFAFPYSISQITCFEPVAQRICFRLFCRRWRFFFLFIYLFIFPCCHTNQSSRFIFGLFELVAFRSILRHLVRIDYMLFFFQCSFDVYEHWSDFRFFPQLLIKFTSKLAYPSKSPLYTIRKSQGDQRMLNGKNVILCAQVSCAEISQFVSP